MSRKYTTKWLISRCYRCLENYEHQRIFMQNYFKISEKLLTVDPVHVALYKICVSFSKIQGIFHCSEKVHCKEANTEVKRGWGKLQIRSDDHCLSENLTSALLHFRPRTYGAAVKFAESANPGEVNTITVEGDADVALRISWCISLPASNPTSWPQRRLSLQARRQIF